jgi:hypothetical protein
VKPAHHLTAMEDQRDYRLAAADAFERAEQTRDRDVADAYRGLAEAYLMLARFREKPPADPASTTRKRWVVAVVSPR